MHGTGIETINPHTGKDMFKVMLTSCKRHAASASLVSNSHINKGFTGHLLSMCVNFSLKNQYNTLGEQFTPHTPYLVPGSLSSEVDSNSAGGICLMFSTFNLALNYIRAAHWFKGNVTLAFDHTFKMDIKNRPHFTVNVMVRALPHPMSVLVLVHQRHVMLSATVYILLHATTILLPTTRILCQKRYVFTSVMLSATVYILHHATTVLLTTTRIL